MNVFLREGYLLPVAKGGKCVEDINFEDLKLYSFGEKIKQYEYYSDDGETTDFDIRISYSYPEIVMKKSFTAIHLCG